MRSRCNNSNHGDYPYYGGRGIKVCERWDSFENFLEDMGERPEEMTLDRVDSDGNYTPENCRWVNRQEQAQNTRNTTLTKEKVLKIRKYLNEGFSLGSIAAMFGVSVQCICDIKKGRRWNNI